MYEIKQRSTNQLMKKQVSCIIDRFNRVGINVHVGKKAVKKGEFSGIVGKSEKVLELNV